MRIKIVLFLVCLSIYFPEASTDGETVWLKDVTKRFQTGKRTTSDHDLPDQLHFNLKRKSHTLTLNLKRNHQIDPNADIYIVQKFKDGLPVLEKTKNLEKSDVAYYQDRENGAFMTARCVKGSYGQCHILINGNIRIGDRGYDLRPSGSDVTTSDFLEITGLRGKRYVLQEQANIQNRMSIKNKEETNVIEKNAEEKRIDRLRRIPYGQDKHNISLHPDVKFSTRNVEHLQKTSTTGKIIHGRTNTNNDKTRYLQNFYIDILVLADSGLWELFLSMADSVATFDKDRTARELLREYFSHIINGMDLLFKGMERATITINIAIRGFVIFQSVLQFPHIESRVEYYQGYRVIDGRKYFRDLKNWDTQIGSKQIPEYDQAILFTRHVLYDRTIDKTNLDGLSDVAGVCDIGRRVELSFVEDYFTTTTTAAHELGHALGANHDGLGDSQLCSSYDQFIMTTHAPKFTPGKKYNENHWLFSRCSVASFQKTLMNKQCAYTKYVQASDINDEFKKIIMKQPGQRYTLNEQCQFINGHGSVYCGRNLKDICRLMRCTDPITKTCKETYFSAATGTTCGAHKWCQKGLCVPRIVCSK